MCDDITENDINKFKQNGGQLNRRDFVKLSGAAGLAAILPITANALDVAESEVTVMTPDGMADCYFVHPSEGKHPAVLIWPDIKGLRTAYREMGKRLAEVGYSVLVVNPFYRKAKAPVVKEGASFGDPGVQDLLMPLMESLSAETSFVDAKAFVGYLDQQASVDITRKMGTAGYCMGGPLIMRTAAAMPDRVGAAASFHGGGLATEKEDSPHLLIPQTKAQVLHAIAANDDKNTPEVKSVLSAAYAKAGLAAEIEVYEGTLHGWCPPDSLVYNEVQAEKAWAKMLALFERALV